jgi:histidinol-phosphate aminotransferase
MARALDQSSDLQGLDDGLGRFTVPDHIARLEPYQPGKPTEELERELGITGALKMASNENPLGAPTVALEAARRAMADAHLYPDSASCALRQKLAERLGVDPDEIVVGSGSNELIHILVRTFCTPGKDVVVTHRHAFISYVLAARTHGVEAIEAPLAPDLRCDVDALCDAFGPRTRLVFLANPNNPTGAHLTRGELEQILERAPARALVVVDEAYHEYAVALAAGQALDYPVSLAYRAMRPGLVTLRTFSKVYGLAGLAIGYAICDRRAAERLNQTRRPFNVNGVAQAAALAALDDDGHVARSCAAARAGLAELADSFSALGLAVYPTLGNFILVGVGRDAAPVYQGLLRRGVITRHMAAWGLPQHLRVSLAAPPGLARAALAMRAVLRG